MGLHMGNTGQYSVTGAAHHRSPSHDGQAVPCPPDGACAKPGAGRNSIALKPWPQHGAAGAGLERPHSCGFQFRPAVSPAGPRKGACVALGRMCRACGHGM